jgi:hypothetical protein
VEVGIYLQITHTIENEIFVMNVKRKCQWLGLTWIVRHLENSYAISVIGKTMKNLIIFIHHIVLRRGHKLTGKKLSDVQQSQYPFCRICGGRPEENYNFWWFYGKHIDVRNRLLSYGKYHGK